MSPAGHAQQRSAAINVEWEDGEEVVGPQGTGGAPRGELFQSGIHFACLSLCGAGVAGISPVAVRFCIQCETYACLFLHTGFAIVRRQWWWFRRNVVQLRASTPAG